MTLFCFCDFPLFPDINYSVDVCYGLGDASEMYSTVMLHDDSSSPDSSDEEDLDFLFLEAAFGESRNLDSRLNLADLSEIPVLYSLDNHGNIFPFFPFLVCNGSQWPDCPPI